MSTTTNNSTTTKSRLIAHLKESTSEKHVSYLIGSSRDIYSQIIEELEYELSDGCDQADAVSALDDMNCPDLDSWAPYYAQRTEMVRKLNNSEVNSCEDWLEGIYEKPFDGCESFTDCEARIAWAALELGFEEARNDIREEVESFYEEEEA